jgi:hypothetical protein
MPYSWGFTTLFIPNLPTFMSPTFPCLVCEKLKGTKGNLRKFASIPLVPFNLLSLSRELRRFLFLGVYCIIITKKVTLEHVCEKISFS